VLFLNPCLLYVLNTALRCPAFAHLPFKAKAAREMDIAVDTEACKNMFLV
jgi:hypothetical protein